MNMIVLSAAFVLAVGQNNAGRDESDNVRRAVDQANRKYEEFVNNPGIHSNDVAAQYTKDGFILIPNIRMVSGRKAIAEATAQTAGQYKEVKLKTKWLKVYGDAAVELGEWASVIFGEKVSGHYLTAWRLEDGSWLRAGTCSAPGGRALNLIFSDQIAVFGQTEQLTAEGIRSPVIRTVGNRSLALQAAARIDAVLQSYAQAFNSDNPQEIRRFVQSSYLPDAAVVLPGAPALEGQAMIAAACEEASASFANLESEMMMIDVGTHGDMAVGVSTYNVKVQSAAGKPVPTTGYYMTVWVRDQGGGYKIAATATADVSNTPDINYKLNQPR